MAPSIFPNVIGTLYAVYFYIWLHSDFMRNAKLGADEFKVNHTIYIGCFIGIVLSTCLIAPRFNHRWNALMGNVGMAMCSVGVIVTHYLFENKWESSRTLYIFIIHMYSCFLGLTLMGQYVHYNYDRNRLLRIAIPSGATVLGTIVLFNFMEMTNYDDVVPWLAFNLFTIMGVLADVAGPRTAVFYFFEFLNTSQNVVSRRPRRRQ